MANSGYLERSGRRVGFSDRDTSLAAAESLSCREAERTRDAIYHYLVARGKLGATNDEIERALGFLNQTGPSRMLDLRNEPQPRAVWSGLYRQTQHDRAARVWIAPGYEDVEPHPSVVTVPEPIDWRRRALEAEAKVSRLEAALEDERARQPGLFA